MKLSELFAEDTRTSITKDKEDYEAKRKALQDIQLDPETNKDEKLNEYFNKPVKNIQAYFIYKISYL